MKSSTLMNSSVLYVHLSCGQKWMMFKFYLLSDYCSSHHLWGHRRRCLLWLGLLLFMHGPSSPQAKTKALWPLIPFTTPDSGWKEEQCNTAAWLWSLWNSSNPVSFDRYWQSLMRSCLWSLRLPTNPYVCVWLRWGTGGGPLCLNKPVFKRHGGEETALLLLHQEVLASGATVLPRHIYHFKCLIVTEALASHFNVAFKSKCLL